VEMIVLIIALLIFVFVLLMYNININKKIQDLNNIKQKVTNLDVLQEFMSAIGEEESVDNKIQKINNILIEKYDIKYSTIVVFNGAEYVIKATNVHEKHWETLTNLQEEELFRDSITTAIPKYVTVNNEKERLPYQKSEFGRVKTAVFFPLYIDNIYIGYWILESGIPHDYEKLDTTMLEVVKDNILSVLKTVSYQSIVESLERKDLYSQLENVEYLYGKGRKILDKYPTSSVCMFNIININEINEEAGRKMGNAVITKVSEHIKNSISDEYLFVRYMGPKFVIVFSGIDTDSVVEFVQKMKSDIENIKILEEDTKSNDIEEKYISPKLNFVTTTYYKGTALESLNKKMEEYLNQADINESDINLI